MFIRNKAKVACRVSGRWTILELKLREPWIRNHDESWEIRMFCHWYQKGLKDQLCTCVIWWHCWENHERTVGLFQWSDACSRQIDEDWEDCWKQGEHSKSSFDNENTFDYYGYEREIEVADQIVIKELIFV